MRELQTAESRSSLTAILPRIQVKVTAWPKTRKQRTWTLRHAATVIGSHPEAEMQLTGKHVCAAHAVLLNTGEEVLVVDLASQSGTLCNKRRVKRQVLQDGDVLRIGATELHFEIRKPKYKVSSGRAVLVIEDPMAMPTAVRVVRVDDDHSWFINDSVALIGASEHCQVTLEDPGIPAVHSALFATVYGIAMCQVASGAPLKINGKEQRLAFLKRKDRLLIGDVGIMVDFEITAAPAPDPEPAGGSPPAEAEATPAEALPEITDVPTLESSDLPAAAGSVLGSLESKIGALHREISEAWTQINGWRQKLTVEQNNLTQRRRDLENKEKQITRLADEVERRAAELSDHNRFMEESHKEIASQRGALERDSKSIAEREAALEARCAEMGTLSQELEARQGEVERFAAQYASQRDELAALKESIEEQRACIERDRATLQAKTRALETATVDVERRQERLSSGEEKLAYQRKALDEQAQHIDRREHRVQSREQELVAYEKRIGARYEALCEKEQAHHQRVVLMSRFGRFLEEACSLYGQVFEKPIPDADVLCPAPPGEDGSPETDKLSPEEIAEQSRQARQSTVQSLEEQAEQMMNDLGADVSEDDQAPKR